MNKQLNALFSVLIRALIALTVMILVFVIYFIIKEALPTFDEATVPNFLLGQRRMPIAYTGEPLFGAFNFIAATLYASLVAMALVVIMGPGAAIYLSCVVTEWMRGILRSFVDLLADIPSAIYDFAGLALMARLFIRAEVHTGSCALVAGILLAVMLPPFLISSCSETMLRVRERCQPVADALGISEWYMAATIVLPGSWKNILLSMILVTGWAMGETMAVMIATENANLSSSLPGRDKSAASVIILEMGTAVMENTHCHALYTAGLVLVFLLFLVNSDIALLRDRLE